MGNFRTIRIIPEIVVSGFAFYEADISVDFPFPIVRVIYNRIGDIGSLGSRGLRLDLDKQTFIDHLQEPTEDNAVKSVAPNIAAYIVKNMPDDLSRT
jgi:hypothetical protein